MNIQLTLLDGHAVVDDEDDPRQQEYDPGHGDLSRGGGAAVTLETRDINGGHCDTTLDTRGTRDFENRKSYLIIAGGGRVLIHNCCSTYSQLDMYDLFWQQMRRKLNCFLNI